MTQMKETTNVTTGENLKSRDDARMKVKKIAYVSYTHLDVYKRQE